MGIFFRSGLRGRARRRRLSAGNSPIASIVWNAESNAPTRSCKPAIGERTVSGSAEPRTDCRSKRLLGVPKECKRTIEFAGGDLRIGQLKLQTGDPCRILASFLRRQVDELLDRDRCFLGPAKSCKPNDDIERPVARRLTLRCSHLDNRHILCPFQQRQHDGNDPSCFGDTLPGDQDAVEKTSLSGRTNSLSRLLKPVIGFFAVFSAVVSAEWE